ncbi:MAG: GNAT family N-acetyltransferase [Chloroflexi bacterium]|nr:GNAT family N-acetyltransferase [Chloroflexota bacterium]
MPSEPNQEEIEIRPFRIEDQPFLERVAPRIRPGRTASPRDPAALDQFFFDLGSGRLLSEPGAEAFVATVASEPCGLVSVHPDVDYFTGHPRAYVDVMVVAAEVEGKGIGRALMDYVERWARDRSCREVVLDVFAENHGAIAFYDRLGYRPDHVRMAKPVE